MCDICAQFSRRHFLGGAAALPLLHRAKLLEPSLRLPPNGSRRVAITLDACPGWFDTRIADVLLRLEIPATIFITATWMHENPGPLARLMARPDLFRLENHGARHLPAILGLASIFGLAAAGSLPAIRHEVLLGGAVIAQSTGRAPLWYRGAAGFYSPEAIPFIQNLGFKIAGYSLNADEGASLPAETVAARIAAARDGDVIVGHINQPRRPSGAGIAAGLAALHAAGTHFARLDAI